MQENDAKISTLCLICSKINWKSPHRSIATRFWLCWVTLATNFCAPAVLWLLTFPPSMFGRLKTCFVCNAGAQIWLSPLCQVHRHIQSHLYRHQTTETGTAKTDKPVDSVWNTQGLDWNTLNCWQENQVLVADMDRKLLCGTGKREGENIL